MNESHCFSKTNKLIKQTKTFKGKNVKRASAGPFPKSGKDVNNKFLAHAPNEDF